MDMVVLREIEAFGHGEPTLLEAGILLKPPLNEDVPQNDPKAFDRFRQRTACNSASAGT